VLESLYGGFKIGRLDPLLHQFDFVLISWKFCKVNLIPGFGLVPDYLDNFVNFYKV